MYELRSDRREWFSVLYVLLKVAAWQVSRVLFVWSTIVLIHRYYTGTMSPDVVPIWAVALAVWSVDMIRHDVPDKPGPQA